MGTSNRKTALPSARRRAINPYHPIPNPLQTSLSSESPPRCKGYTKKRQPAAAQSRRIHHHPSHPPTKSAPRLPQGRSPRPRDKAARTSHHCPVKPSIPGSPRADGRRLLAISHLESHPRPTNRHRHITSHSNSPIPGPPAPRQGLGPRGTTAVPRLPIIMSHAAPSYSLSYALGPRDFFDISCTWHSQNHLSDEFSREKSMYIEQRGNPIRCAIPAPCLDLSDTCPCSST